MKRIFTYVLAATLLTSLNSGAITPHSIDVDHPTVKEDFNSMWDASTSQALLSLPSGWAVDRNLSAPRSIGKWNETASEVMYAGGESLASNAKNGTWNFGASSDNTDRAIGGLSTTVSNGTRCVNLMTALTNESNETIDRLEISYNIEKYRKGANAAGFDVQLFYSFNGENWINAGETFLNHFLPDSETIGTEVVPISVTAVNKKQLLADITPGATIYLAWNISVASGSSPDKAPGLAIDDIELTASFADDSIGHLLIENALKAKNISVYSPDSEIFGKAPGSQSTLSKVINGVNYNLWEIAGATPTEIIVVADGKSYGPIGISNDGDTYLCLYAEGLSLISDPDNYSGWVDPNRAPFVASGIYLRGEVNSWGADPEWEFSKESENTYVMYDKTLSGQFKIADANWSSSCNFGSNGSNIVVDKPYSLVSATDNNISCGSYIFDCKRIILTIINGAATLLLENDDDDRNLTAVYVYGDFNNWDFMSTAGKLELDEADNLFKGQLSMKAGPDGMAHWRIYQRPGLGGAWGLEANASEHSLDGTLLRGHTGNVAVIPGTYNISFSINDGRYNLTPVEAQPSKMVLYPGKAILTPENPQKIKVLSLNNSLIHYNDQDFVFNDIARSMGIDASWTKHTNLGKPLSYHWEEGDGLAEDGTPGAKMMIRSDAWSHIILQEQSSLPRTNPETFRKSVALWMDYIRQYCPNPNAVVILPVNWAYSSDLDNFVNYNARFMDVYSEIAAEFGAVVVPVASAYDNAFIKEGNDELSTWFSDDRHPTPKATYMAACMEFATITGTNPAYIDFVPTGISADDAEKMRRYASEALAAYTNTVSHLDGTVSFNAHLYDDFGIELTPESIDYSVDGGGTITPDGVFTSDGTRGEFTVTVNSGNFNETAVIKVTDHAVEVVRYPAIKLNADNLSAKEDFDSMGDKADANLPESWRIDRQTISTRTLGTYATAQSNTMYSGGVALPSNAKNGLWNFGNNKGDDRALGGITTGVAGGTRSVNIYTHLLNDGRKPLAKVNVKYDVEKYRKGNNAAGFAVQLYYSYDGRNWENAGNEFLTIITPDAVTEGYDEAPGEIFPVEATLPVSLGAGMDLYLAWNISVASGDAAQGAPALAIDNVQFEGSLPEVPVTRHRIYVDNKTSWDAIGLYAWGDSELFGAWPGQAPIDELQKDGVVYTVFGLDADGGNYNLIFNNWNNNKQLPDYPITADRDYWLEIDDNGVKESLTSISMTEADDSKSIVLRYNVIYVEDNLPIAIYTPDGRRIKSGFGPELNIDNLPKGFYIVVTPKDSLKIALN